jgi:two-component system, OmpR family, response regulator ChvI
MDGLNIKTKADYYSNKFEKIYSSIGPKSYDEIITKLHLQAREEYQSTTMQYSQKQKIEDEEGLHNQTRGRKRILLVDDEPDICMVYQIILQDAGYECVSYTDSVKALQEFRPNYYDLVMLDIKMPKLDGFALCEKIRELDKTVQIIFITAAEEYYENFRKEYYPALSNDINIKCLQKPIGNEELIQIVNMTIATTDTT